MLIAKGKLEHQEQITSAEPKLPSTVQSPIRRSLSALSDRTNSLLAVASALGIEFELAPLERVAAAPSGEILDYLDEATVAGIIAAVRGSRACYRFSHALIRSAIYDSLGSKKRIELHRIRNWRITTARQFRFRSDCPLQLRPGSRVLDHRLHHTYFQLAAGEALPTRATDW